MEEVVWADRRKVTKYGGSHMVSLPKSFFKPGEYVQLRLYKDKDKLKLVIEKLPPE